MHDELWSTDRQSDRLRTLRGDGRSVWQDTAARDITSRWLDPHDDLAGVIATQSRQQHESLADAQRQQREADDQAQVAAARAADTVGWLHQLDAAADRARAAAAEADELAARTTRASEAAHAEAATAQRILADAR